MSGHETYNHERKNNKRPNILAFFIEKPYLCQLEEEAEENSTTAYCKSTLILQQIELEIKKSSIYIIKQHLAQQVFIPCISSIGSIITD